MIRQKGLEALCAWQQSPCMCPSMAQACEIPASLALSQARQGVRARRTARTSTDRVRVKITLRMRSVYTLFLKWTFPFVRTFWIQAIPGGADLI
jgi:hypothetical protein